MGSTLQINERQAMRLLVLLLAILAGCDRAVTKETQVSAAELVERQRQAAEAASAAKHQRCVTEVALVIESARRQLAKSDPLGASRELDQCKGSLVDPAALALVKKVDAAVEKREAEVKAAAAKAERDFLAKEKARKKREGVSIGMSQQDVLDSSWGRPESVNRSTNAYGTREQWVYGGRNYLYFENGKLTAIQN